VIRTSGPAHHDALELLERALGYTRVALSTVGPDRSGPSPCAGWTLADLLGHMDDGLDAFLEAAGGAVHVPAEVPVPRGAGADLAVLQSKACRLLGVWSARTPALVVVGDRPVPSGLLVSAAALEIAVHGWDVGQATGAGRGLPDDLAVALMPVAHAVVTPEDRPERFAAPVLSGHEAGSSEVLLGFLGRARPDQSEALFCRSSHI
jgi:uncharacterized protein (TIGR03086 family)